MKITVCVVFLIIAVSLNSAPVFFLSLDSFTGGYYYPEREDKDWAYHNKHHILFGLDNLQKGSNKLRITGEGENRLQEWTLNLNSLHLTHQSHPAWYLQFKIDHIGFGRATEIFDSDPLDPYFRLYRLGDYRFTGLHFHHQPEERFAFSYKLGGNNHNTSLATISSSYLTDHLRLSLFYLYAGRDNNFNKTMHSYGTEVKIETHHFDIFHSQTKQHLDSTYSRENYLTYGEILINLSTMIKCGGSIFYAEEYRGYKHWRDYTVLTSLRMRRFRQDIKYTYAETGDLLNKGVGVISLYNINENLSLGINGTVFLPMTGKNYFRIGLQVSFNEDFRL